MERLAQLELFLNQHLLGQREVIAEFCSTIIRAERGPRHPSRPRAFLLALGPTGTGKTEMVQLAAQFLYGAGGAGRLERFDMGEYQHPDSVRRLLGAPDQPPLLGRAVERLNARGGGILLLDEIEKAFPDLLTTLLSFDSARTTMYDGRCHDLSALTIVLTSNLGAADAARMEHSGYSAVSRRLRYAAEERFGKEGVARFTSVLCMNVLGYPVQCEIARRFLERELDAWSRHLRRSVEVTPSVLTFLVSRGFSPDLGARHIRHCVERHIGDSLRPHLFAPNGAGVAPTADRSRWCGAILDRASEAIVLDVADEQLTARTASRAWAWRDLPVAARQRPSPPPLVPTTRGPAPAANSAFARAAAAPPFLSSANYVHRESPGYAPRTLSGRR